MRDRVSSSSKSGAEGAAWVLARGRSESSESAPVRSEVGKGGGSDRVTTGIEGAGGGGGAAAADCPPPPVPAWKDGRAGIEGGFGAGAGGIGRGRRADVVGTAADGADALGNKGTVRIGSALTDEIDETGEPETFEVARAGVGGPFCGLEGGVSRGRYSPTRAPPVCRARV